MQRKLHLEVPWVRPVTAGPPFTPGPIPRVTQACNFDDISIIP